MRESLGKHKLLGVSGENKIKKRAGYFVEANFSNLMILPKAETAKGDKELQAEDLG